MLCRDKRLRSSMEKNSSPLAHQRKLPLPLFREEVFNKRQQSQYGVICLNAPMSYHVIVTGLVLITILFMSILKFAEFSEKFVVSGYLDSNPSIVLIDAYKNGVLTQLFVKQGQFVHKGDKLFLLDTSKGDSSDHSHANIFSELQYRQTKTIEAIQQKQHDLKNYQHLLGKKYISLNDYHLKKNELLNLQKEHSLIKIELLRYQQEQTYLVRAPIDGEIATISGSIGQSVQTQIPLIKILPKNATFVAKLFVPVKQSGFLNKKSHIYIHYDAYPYLRFGSYKAAIQEIARSVSIDEEEVKPIKVGEPYYKVIAALNEQSVQAYGVARHLQHGMTFSAVISGQKRTLWHWVFEPLYSFYGE